ncbi:uncharacterized protein LOC110445416 [Mizuhopecten yessoensis]|uniref:Uncharacterized protein n=1 Tax=Mizuhopecten yessoensis TaxID=6573 RepID=A0A210R000_MIZYE|nr:uncharacterized protein LOC110445416 [Mizuhopecten yessoensis]OWF54231.1 hypothetical protein KP79_PYT22978 [Mizuhopecten yessoensis]
MFSRLSAKLLRPTAVRSSVIRKFGGGESPYEKVFTRESVLHPAHAVKDIGLVFVVMVTGFGMTAAVTYPIYYLCTSLDITLNRSRPYTWLDDVRPGHKDVLMGRRTFGDMHEDIKTIRSVLSNPNNEQLMSQKQLAEKVTELNNPKPAA